MCRSISGKSILVLMQFFPNYRITLTAHIVSMKQELNRRLIYECRCDERLKPKSEGSTRLTYTGLSGGLEHLKIETRLIDERFGEENEF
jgi:hypothetical protein